MPQGETKPLTLQQFIDLAGDKLGVPKELRNAIFQKESDFDHYSGSSVKRSPKGALGVGQLMTGTAARLNVNPYDPIDNAYGALKEQKRLYDKYLAATKDEKKAMLLTAAAYNAGEGAVEKFGGIPPFAETQDYVKFVANQIRTTAKSDVLQSPKGDFLNNAVDVAKAKDDFIKSFPQHLEWHLGVPASVASWWFGELPEDKQKLVAQTVAKAVAEDQVKKSQGVPLTKDPVYQAGMRKKLQVFYAPSASQGPSPSMQAAGQAGGEMLASKRLPARMLTEAFRQGFAGIAEAYGGATRLLAGGTYQHPLTEEESWKIGGGGAEASEWAKRMKEGGRIGEQIKPMPKAARLATNLAGGAIEYAPLMLVPEAGLESVFARMALSGAAGGTYTGLQAIGRDEPSKEVVKQGLIGTGEFALMGAPKIGKPLTKEAETTLNKTLFRRAASNIVLSTGVGGSVAVIERATGKSWSDAATQGFLLAAMRHGGDLLKLVKVKDAKTGEVRPATPELIEALARKESFQERPPLSPEAPQLNSVRLRELNQAIQKAENDLKLVKYSTGGRTRRSTKLENTIVKRITDLTRERNQIMDRGPRRAFEGEPKRKVAERARTVGQQVPPLTKATEPIASRFPSALESPLGEPALKEPSELASLGLDRLQEEFDALKANKNRTSAQKLTMGTLKTQIDALKSQGVADLPKVQVTPTASVRTAASPQMTSVDAGPEGKVPIWQQLGDEGGYVNVGDAFKAVGDFFRGLPREISADLYAATLKAVQGHERAQAEMGATRSRMFDNTFEAAEVATSRLKPQVVQDIMLSRGAAGTAEGLKIQNEAKARLAAITNPYLKSQVDKLTKTAQEGYDWVHGYATKSGVNVAYRPDYFYGVWDAPPEKIDGFLNAWKTTKRYQKTKSIPTVADGLAYGLKLKDQNPFSNMRRELVDIQRRVSMEDLAAHLKTQPSTALEIGKIPKDRFYNLMAEGWVPLKDPAFKGLIFEPTYAKHLNRLLESNFMGLKKPLRALREVSRLGQKLKFMGSLFHFKNMIKASISAETGGVLNPKGWKDAWWSASWGSYNLKRVGIDPLGKDHLEYVNLSGGHHYSLESQGAQAFGQELNTLIERNLGPTAGKITRGVSSLPTMPGFQRWLFNNYIPTLKEIKYFRDLSYMERKVGRGLTDAEKLEIIKRNQNFYGEMNERLFGRSRGMTSALRIPFTAPGFGEGNLRTMARAIKEPLQAAGKLRRGEPLTKMDIRSAQFMIQSWVFSALVAQVGTRLLTGQWATPKTIREMFMTNSGETDKDGAPIYFDMLSYDKDYWTALGLATNLAGVPTSAKEKLGVAPTIHKSLNEVRQRIAGAEAPIMGAFEAAGTYIMTGQVYDWRGRPLLREGQTGHNLKALGSVAVDRFEPIAISTVRQALSTGIDLHKALEASIYGFRPQRMPGIYQIAHDFNVKSGKSTASVFEASDYQSLNSALGSSDAKDAFNELHKTKTTGQILKYYHDRVNKPLTSSLELEKKFVESLTPEQKKLYEADRAKRQRDLEEIEKLTGISPPPTRLKLHVKHPSVYDTP